MLTLHLKPIFTARGIENPLRFLMKNGIARDAASHLIRSQRPYIRIEHMELLCELLRCEPNDLFLWQPGKDVKVKEDHPLFPLYRPQEIPANFRKLLADVPYKKLKILAETLAQEIDGKTEATDPVS